MWKRHDYRLTKEMEHKTVTLNFKHKLTETIDHKQVLNQALVQQLTTEFCATVETPRYPPPYFFFPKHSL